MPKKHTRPKRPSTRGLGENLEVRERGRPIKERVSTNDSTLQGTFTNNTRKEGGGATLKVVDKDPLVTTYIVEPRSSKVVAMNLREKGNTVEIETENRYGKKETSYITEVPYENLQEAIKSTDYHQNKALIKQYKQHEIRALADSLGVPLNKSQDVTLNNIRAKLNSQKERKSEVLTTKQVQRHDYYIMAIHEATSPEQLTVLYNELIDDPNLPDIYKKEMKYRLENKGNELREEHLKEISRHKELGKRDYEHLKHDLYDADTPSQIDQVRERMAVEGEYINAEQMNDLMKLYDQRRGYLMDRESDKSIQQYLTDIKGATTQKELYSIKESMAQNQYFNPTDNQIEDLNQTYKKAEHKLHTANFIHKPTHKVFREGPYKDKAVNNSSDEEEEYFTKMRTMPLPPQHSLDTFTDNLRDAYNEINTKEKRGGMIPFNKIRPILAQDGYTREEQDRYLLALEKNRIIDLQIASDTKVLSDPQSPLYSQNRGAINYVVWRR